MPGPIQHERAVERQLIGARLHDIEATITQMHRRTTGETARLRRIEHLDADARVLWRTRVADTEWMCDA
jgi:hypothetical protein